MRNVRKMWVPSIRKGRLQFTWAAFDVLENKFAYDSRSGCMVFSFEEDRQFGLNQNANFEIFLDSRPFRGMFQQYSSAAFEVIDGSIKLRLSTADITMAALVALRKD